MEVFIGEILRQSSCCYVILIFAVKHILHIVEDMLCIHLNRAMIFFNIRQNPFIDGLYFGFTHNILQAGGHLVSCLVAGTKVFALFPTKGDGIGGGKNFFSREKKFFPPPNPLLFQKKRDILKVKTIPYQ